MLHRPTNLHRTSAGLLLALCLAAPVQAQSIRLHVTEAASGRPVAGGVADLLDDHGTVVAAGVLSSDGRYLLTLPGAGSYRVRVRRIGYEPFVVNAPPVAGTATVEMALSVPDRRVRLSTIVVTAHPRCSRDAFRDHSVATLWEEVRTALTTTMLSRADSALLLESRAFRRKLDADRSSTEELVGLPRLTGGGKPYGSLEASDLARDGYVRRIGDETIFYAPDERVLLSDQFVDERCFEVVRGSGAAAGLFGLRFTAADRRHANDIAGTLWVDSASASLRYLDFRYENEFMPRTVIGDDRSGGQVIFDRLAGGRWIVSAWRLRMPHFDVGRRLTQRSYPDGYEEVGGVVTPMPGDSAPPRAVAESYRALLAPARVTGTVYDSLTGGPLQGAQVWLLPIEPASVIAAGLALGNGRLAVHPVTDVTDATGHFALRMMPAGTYRLAFEDSRLDSIGVTTAYHDIRLRPGATVVADLAVPSLSTLRQGCVRPRGALPTPAGGMITGIVRAAGDERPLEGALVRVSWIGLQHAASILEQFASTVVETKTDSLGRYRVCGVPDSAFANVMAAGPHSTTGEVQTQVGPVGIARVNLRLAEVSEGESEPPAGALAGVVMDSLGAPVGDAQITLDGSSATTRTDAAGRFRLAPVQSGTQTIEVKRVGLDVARRPVDIAPSATTTVSFTLVRSHLLDRMLITAQRERSSPEIVDAVRRHRAGAGILLMEDEIQQRFSVQSLLERIPGVRTSRGAGGMGWVAVMRTAGRECVARVFIDGRESDYDEALSLTPDRLAAVEVFVRAGTAPIFTAGRSVFGSGEACGVIIFWLKR